MKIIQSRKNGFTLLELLVTTVMIAVLTIIGVVSYSSVNKRSRDVKRKSDLEQIRSALEMYRSEHGEYPHSGSPQSQSLTDNVLSVLVDEEFIPVIPMDPQGGYETGKKNYQYYSQGNANGIFTTYCLSAMLESPATTDIPQCPDHPIDYNYSLKNP
jgi:general secretion pathway protein G